MVLHHLPQSSPSASPTTGDPRRPRRPAAAADDRSAPFAHLATGQQLEPPSPAACITPTSRTHPSHAGQQSAIAAPPPATPDRNRNNSPIQSPLSFFSNAGKPSTHLHHAHEQNPSRPNQAGSPHFSHFFVRHHGPAGYIFRSPFNPATNGSPHHPSIAPTTHASSRWVETHLAVHAKHLLCISSDRSTINQAARPKQRATASASPSSSTIHQTNPSAAWSTFIHRIQIRRPAMPATRPRSITTVSVHITAPFGHPDPASCTPPQPRSHCPTPVARHPTTPSRAGRRRQICHHPSSPTQIRPTPNPRARSIPPTASSSCDQQQSTSDRPQPTVIMWASRQLHNIQPKA